MDKGAKTERIFFSLVRVNVLIFVLLFVFFVVEKIVWYCLLIPCLQKYKSHNTETISHFKFQLVRISFIFLHWILFTCKYLQSLAISSNHLCFITSEEKKCHKKVCNNVTTFYLECFTNRCFAKKIAWKLKTVQSKKFHKKCFYELFTYAITVPGVIF